jgi:hypothetical protein
MQHFSPPFLTLAEPGAPYAGPSSFRVVWQGQVFNCRLWRSQGDAGQSQASADSILELYAKVGRLPYSAESLTARAMWKATLADLRENDQIAGFLHVGKSGPIYCRFKTSLGPNPTSAQLIHAAALCLAQASPVLMACKALRQSKQLRRLVSGQAPPGFAPGKSDLDL